MSIPRTRNSCTAHADCLRAGKMLGKAKQQNSVLLTLMARKSVLSNPPAHQPCGFECCKAMIFKDGETSGSSSPLIIQRDDRKFSRVRRVVACGSFQRKRAHVVCLGRNVENILTRASYSDAPTSFPITTTLGFCCGMGQWYTVCQEHLALPSIAGHRSLLHLIFQCRRTRPNCSR